eukprot:TRINITY_DN10036_c0_g1_i2.p1 TRINITY_DN10036_c0_g1~~TRINITY_DN10036_c0_g1_i2.p1  ORF type:complete len:167 (-),score=21.47 TRINITY_DN10036_c0_g1_i2:698-1198(-)
MINQVFVFKLKLAGDMSTPGSTEPVTPSTPQSLVRNNLVHGEDLTYAPIRFTRGQYDEAEERGGRRLNFSMNVSQRLNFEDADNQDYPAADPITQGQFNRIRPDVTPEQDHSRKILQRKLKDLKAMADEIISDTEWMFDVPLPSARPLTGDNLMNLYQSKQIRESL